MTSVNCALCYAPLGDISIGIKCAPGVVGPAEADIDFDIIKNDNDTFTVKYTPPGAGRYTIMVLFADQVWINIQYKRDWLNSEEWFLEFYLFLSKTLKIYNDWFCQEIPSSPFKVKVDPSHDAGKVRAEGPGLNKTGETHWELGLVLTLRCICNKHLYNIWLDKDRQHWQNTCMFQEWRWALQPTSPSTQREQARPSLRCILQHRAQERQFVTLRSSITTITPTLSSTRLFSRYSVEPISFRAACRDKINQYSYFLWLLRVTWQFQSLMEEIPFPRAPSTLQWHHLWILERWKWRD